MNANLILSENQKKLDRIYNLMESLELAFESKLIPARLINWQDNRLRKIAAQLERVKLIAFVPQMIERGCFN